MNRLAPALLASLAVLALPALAQNKPAADKKIYCWDEGGRKVCGDALPADAVDNARTEFNESGMATRRLDRAPTDAERVELEARAEQERIAAAAVAARERRELAMVESYASEADLRQAYQHRIGLLETAVKTSMLSIDGLRDSLVVRYLRVLALYSGDAPEWRDELDRLLELFPSQAENAKLRPLLAAR